MSAIIEDSQDKLLSNIVCDTVPTQSIYYQNLDFSTFPLLCEMVHKHFINLKLFDTMNWRMNLPFAVFQHYMTVLLNIHLFNYNEYDARYLSVPGPIAEYLSAITTTTTLTGDTIQINIPNIAVPKLSVLNEGNKAYIPPGSFGCLTAENHNVYECYVSPYITRRLVEQTREQKFVGCWNPLPDGAYPDGTVPNKNLLGYAYPEKLTPESVSMLKKYNFPNTDNITGRFQIVPQLMDDTNKTLCKLREVYELVPFHTIQQKSTQKSQHLVGITKVSTLPYDMDTRKVQISKLGGDILSPYPLKSKSVKMNMLYGLKRSRTTVVPGYCYTTPEGKAPDGWKRSINNNFNMEVPFESMKYPDYSHLRDEYHIATLPKGDRIDFINDWIKSYNRK